MSTVVKEGDDYAIVHDIHLVSQTIKTPILRGCTEILYQQVPPSMVGTNSISFNVITPEPTVEIDRNINLLVPVRLTLTMQNVPLGAFILNPGLCNLRSFPLQKSMERISLTMNSRTVSLGIGRIQSALELFNNGSTTTLRNLEYSKTPTYGCNQTQSFNDLMAGTRSPLATYINSIAGVAPQSFPFTIVSQTAADDTGVATSIVDYVGVESINISPLYWGLAKNNSHALAGLYTMDFTFEFYTNAGFRMIAINNTSDAIPLGDGPITVGQQFSFKASDNFSYPDWQPRLLLQMLKPQIALPIGGPFKYPYYNIETYVTGQKNSVAPGATTIVVSSNLSIPRLPSKILIFASKPMSTFLQDPFTPDTFMSLENLAIQWNNKLVLTTAHKSQIYDISVRNGLQMDYTSWSGYGINNEAPAGAGGTGFGSPGEQFHGLGSPIWVGPLDLGITPDMSQQPHIQIQLQVTATMRNISQDTFVPEIVIAILTDGFMTIADGLVNLEQGVIQTSLENPIKSANPDVTREPTMSVWKPSQPGGGSMSVAFKESLAHLFRRAKKYEK